MIVKARAHHVGEKTALSDHLYNLFQAWSRDYLFAPGSYTHLFEEFELLGSLAFIIGSNSKDMLQAALKGPSGSNFVWAPIGRVSWDGQTRRRILEKWKLQDTTEELMRAGFAPSD